MSDKEKPKPSEQTQDLAVYIAMVVRNAMEDFHCENLSDEQMKELNPIVRDEICTALHAFQNYEDSDVNKKFVNFHVRSILKYWARPVLIDDYLES
jgi:hypothetical protein